ncbi:MAG: hypothetical protein A2381_02035 [Bdellovibrionales bacterium RIFOXYB1_FULL_37_110]|nr:MAG: hypothetical protein A2417_13340 [Bdellovibrionales bacterium RIFOXYC1_FULL_37_79]OFZ59219.1 MAG: hypothetical protein A2381_02035 [Bdellovibrionales bacterium RIFOXYB1_FULL_37_110]OFZ62845.1 MAG: hypothetical protein A2577_10990 [Bdellovibrionales bacterium RIFOXYD1_FULL_36_51]
MFLIYTLIFFNSLNLLAQDFPVEGRMQIRVDFWKKVYTEITTEEAFLHDINDLSIVYKKVTLPPSQRERLRFIKQEKKELANILKSIAHKNYQNLTDQEQSIANIIGEKSPDYLLALSSNLRFQYGLKDRYYQGLIESYKYLEHIKKIFKDLNLPEELAYLPHVESSFNYKAYSKVGAAGIWQFMRATARKYHLKVTYTVDERRDVIKATYAAAKFLKDNFNLLGTWPLALTAYNHGPKSIERAINQLGTNKIHEIVELYDGRRFGFASQNFYATYMATVEISKNPEKYFESFKAPPKFDFSIFALDREYTVSQIIKNLNISKEVLQTYNPSIRPIAYQGEFRLPKNFHLHIPVTTNEQMVQFQDSLKTVKEEVNTFGTENIHLVAGGENLYDISRIYNTSMDNIINYNQISNPSRIYAGMKIKIPAKNVKTLALASKEKTTVTATPIITQSSEINQTASPQAAVIAQLPAVEATAILPADTSISKPTINLQKYELDVILVSDNIYTITIETEETLGHYADWAKIRTEQIRHLNQLNIRSTIHLGQKIKIQFSNESLIEFKKLRNQYHIAIQEDFFNNYSVATTKEYKVMRGDILSNILKRFELPYWLARNYQSSRQLTDKLSVGQIITIPEIVAR